MDERSLIDALQLGAARAERITEATTRAPATRVVTLPKAAYLLQNQCRSNYRARVRGQAGFSSIATTKSPRSCRSHFPAFDGAKGRQRPNVALSRRRGSRNVRKGATCDAAPVNVHRPCRTRPNQWPWLQIVYPQACGSCSCARLNSCARHFVRQLHSCSPTKSKPTHR